MSIRDQIAFLEELSSIDVELRRVEEQLEKHHKGLSGMQSELRSLEERLKIDRETAAAMDRTRNDLVTELRQMTQQIDRSREKLQRSRNERESNAAQREVEELRKLHRDREEELDRLNLAADAARRARAAASVLFPPSSSPKLRETTLARRLSVGHHGIRVPPPRRERSRS